MARAIDAVWRAVTWELGCSQHLTPGSQSVVIKLVLRYAAESSLSDSAVHQSATFPARLIMASGHVN